MTNGVIHTWFPKSVYISDNLLMDQLATYETEIKKILGFGNVKRTSVLNVDSTHQLDRSFHTNPVFKDLVEMIYKNSKLFLLELGYDEKFIDRLSIQNMWGNVSGQGDFLFPHVHPNSLLSGAFYIKKCQDSRITFFDNIYNMNIEPQHEAPLNYHSCSYSCDPGRMILFRSDFLHGTGKQSDGEKIVVSFNLGLNNA